MIVENQDNLARPLELQGTSKDDVHRRSKTVYTREFLLSCADLVDCKQFLTGFDSSVCRKLEDDFKGILEPWKGSGILFLPNSGNIRCRALFSGLDSNGSSEESVGRSDYLSLRWSRESNSQGSYDSDFRRHDLTKCLAKVSGCKAEVMAKRFHETEKNDYCQLNKSENPYRPPQTYQGGRTKYESKYDSKETLIEKMGSGVKEDMQLERPTIAEGEQHEIKDTTSLAKNIRNCPVYHVKPFCHDFKFSEHIVTSDSQIMQFGSKRANMSTITEDLNEEQSRMTLKEDIASSLKVPSGCSATFIEKALPQPLAVNCECEKGFSGNTCFPITEDFCSMLKDSSDSNCNSDSHMIQSHKSISGTEFIKFLSEKQSHNSGHRASFNQIAREEVLELYEFPFTLAYDLVSSVLREDNLIRTNHQGITDAAAAAEVIYSYDMEENECTFDDMWSEILEILQFEQEMELASTSESNQTSDFKVQISLAVEHSLISIDNPVSSEQSIFVPSNSSNNIAHYDAEIHLPDENSLITIDDLIAPEDRLISTDYPKRAEHAKLVPLDSCFGAADNAEIHLPDEDDLITIDDLIAPEHLKFIASGQPETESTWTSGVRDEVVRPRSLVITNPAKGSAAQGLEVPSSLDLTLSKAYQELHFCHSSLHHPCNIISSEMDVCYPFNSLEAQTSLQTTSMGSVPCRRYPALNWYSCPNVVHQFPGKTACPKLEEFCYPHVQYSRFQQPSNFLQQNHFPTKDRAFSISEMEKKQHFPPRHQQTAYPDIAVANSGMSIMWI